MKRIYTYMGVVGSAVNQSINQSTNQPTNPSINQPINHSISNQSINQSINHSISHQSIKQSINHSISNQSINRSINQSNQSFDQQSVNRPTDQSLMYRLIAELVLDIERESSLIRYRKQKNESIRFSIFDTSKSSFNISIKRYGDATGLRAKHVRYDTYDISKLSTQYPKLQHTRKHKYVVLYV